MSAVFSSPFVSSTAAPGMGVNLEGRKEITITEEEIAATLENWDVQAFGQKLFVARLRNTKSSGKHGVPIHLAEDATMVEEQSDAVVISAGPQAYVNSEWPTDKDGQPLDPRWLNDDELNMATRRFLKPGDRITFGRYAGGTVCRKGTVSKGLDTLMVINADDVIGKPVAR